MDDSQLQTAEEGQKRQLLLADISVAVCIGYADDIVVGFEHRSTPSGFGRTCGRVWRSLL
jgi:hypothetical protein